MKRKISDVTDVGIIKLERVVFDDPRLRVIEREIKTKENKRIQQLVWSRTGRQYAVAVGVTADNLFVLVREPKFGQMNNMLTVATGGINPNETPFAAAAREFMEETGYVSDHWIPLRNGKPMVDFADKTDGGEHFFFLGLNAHKVCEPEHEVLLLSKDEVMDELEGYGDLSVDIAMSFVALSLSLGRV